ncbi:MAG: transcriptional repressor LexA [Acidobacteriota bacterium]|nr:transcriptional repressor LexA [Acidobacteriota bacterium]MEE3273534.1 transcriptional repressor LexA [Acidobacteriota bacterium]
MYLTKRQKEILDYINRYVDENGYAPTLKEIGTGFGLSSPATVYNHIELLVQKGYLKKTPHQGRGIELVDGDPVRTIEVPILGQISAARIIQATTAGETVNLPPDFITRKAIYALRVLGNSLANEHVCDGDLIIVEDRTTAEDGEMVLASLEDKKVFLRKHYLEGQRTRFQPTNPAGASWLVDKERVRVQGVVAGLMRRYR